MKLSPSGGFEGQASPPNGRFLYVTHWLKFAKRSRLAPGRGRLFGCVDFTVEGRSKARIAVRYYQACFVCTASRPFRAGPNPAV